MNKKEQFKLSERFKFSLHIILFLYLIISYFLDALSFRIASYLIILSSFHSLFTAIYFKKAGGPGGVETSGKSGLYWGIARFLFYLIIGLVLYFYDT